MSDPWSAPAPEGAHFLPPPETPATRIGPQFGGLTPEQLDIARRINDGGIVITDHDAGDTDPTQLREGAD